MEELSDLEESLRAEDEFYRAHLFLEEMKTAVLEEKVNPDEVENLTGSADRTARLWEIKMPLEEFLEKGLCEELSEAQKREYGIKD